ncbi:MAG: Integrase [Marmoricola sp.]|nr:Integrase [Marmoricola sp.]
MKIRNLAQIPAPSHDAPCLTVARYLSVWLAGKQSLRPSTRASYESHVRLYLVPHLGQVVLGDLRPEHIEEMYARIESGNGARTRPVSTATRRRVHATLNSALSTAVRRGLIDRNPATTVELPAVRKARVDVWTAVELGRFLGLISDDRLHLLYVLLGLRGLRRGEVVALRWSDVDLDHGYLRIEQSAVRVGNRSVIGPPKSASGARVVAIDAATVDRLGRHRDQQDCERGDRIGNPVTSDLVFTAQDGDPLDPTYVSRHFDKLVAIHGLPRIRLHDLRHTSASVGLAAGESLIEVSRRLGHSSIVVTADIYCHIAPHVAQESAERLADLVFAH